MIRCSVTGKVVCLMKILLVFLILLVLVGMKSVVNYAKYKQSLNDEKKEDE